MARLCSVLRVFTRAGEGGNHLGVVTDLTGLTDQKMQQIAAELGFSETVFIDWVEGEVPVTRIFTQEMEMPFAGHPLVGAASVMLSISTADRLRCGIGEVTIRVAGDVFWVDIPLVPGNAHVDTSSFATAVGLPDPVSEWRVEMPLDYRIIELQSSQDVSEIAPDTQAFGDTFGLAVYARNGDRVRM